MAAVFFAWLVAFALTQVVEIPIHARALAEVDARARASGRPPPHGPRRWLLAFTASALTHPFV